MWRRNKNYKRFKVRKTTSKTYDGNQPIVWSECWDGLPTWNWHKCLITQVTVSVKDQSFVNWFRLENTLECSQFWTLLKCSQLHPGWGCSNEDDRRQELPVTVSKVRSFTSNFKLYSKRTTFKPKHVLRWVFIFFLTWCKLFIIVVTLIQCLLGHLKPVWDSTPGWDP